jgi:translation initiation factor IF-3
VTLDHLVNENIISKDVRLIGEQHQQIGIISTHAALDRARQQGLDLVVISQSSPPVVKIVDYSKFKYELIKREKELAKKVRASKIDLKEIQLRPVTDVRDVEIKAKKAQAFLSDGDKVKVVVKFKGREVSHAELGRKILENFLGHLSDYKIEKAITLTGRDMMMIVAPFKPVTNELPKLVQN